MAKADDELTEAINDRDLSRVKRAVSAGADVGPDDYGETALMWAAYAGNLPVVKFLAGVLRKDINAVSLGGATALIRASLSGNLEVVRYLVEKGANLDAAETSCSVNGYSRSVMIGWESHHGTALIGAVSIGSLEIVRYLVDRGADVTIRNTWGHTAFENALRYDRPEIVDFFLERLKISRESGLVAAARFNLSQVKRFVEKLGVSAGAVDDAGYTGLMASAKDGDYEFLGDGPHPGPLPDHVIMATYLIEHGCPVDARNRDGQTALMFAAGAERSGLVHYLIQSGADPNLRDRWGNAPLDYVVIPESPDPESENAYEAWCWSSAATRQLQDSLRSAMEKAKGQAGKPCVTCEDPF